VLREHELRVPLPFVGGGVIDARQRARVAVNGLPWSYPTGIALLVRPEVA
jgi:hypothetical protein